MSHGGVRYIERQIRRWRGQFEQMKVEGVDHETVVEEVGDQLARSIPFQQRVAVVHGDYRLDNTVLDAQGKVRAILDWEMPSPNGPEFMRQLRSPGHFPMPDVPVIMLTAYGERSRVVEAVRLGVNEFLLKPVSSTALLARLISILANPRRMVKKGDYYGPEPRRMSTYKPENDPALSQIVLLN